MKKEEIEFNLLRLDLDVKKLFSIGRELTTEELDFVAESLTEMEKLKHELQLYKDGAQ